MNELLRFTATGQNGPLVFLPPKFEFVFYEAKLEMYKKGKLERTINYEDIKEVVVIKNWQNNVFINCKPIGVNIYKVSDEICNKIKEITLKQGTNNEYLQNILGDAFEKNGFIKIEKDKKIIIKIYNNGNIIKSYTYNFKTNIINIIPETNIKFAIALEQDNDEYVHFFINRHTTDNDNCTSPTRTLFPGLTNTYSFCRYVFEYKQQPILRVNLDENKIDLDKNNYLEISINKDLLYDKKNNMEKTEEKIINQLKTNGPTSFETIKDVEKELNIKFPKDYIDFMLVYNGATGATTNEYIVIWKMEDIIENNIGYKVKEFFPNLVYFGSDGSGEAYAFDKNENMTIIKVPFICNDVHKYKTVIGTFQDLLKYL